MKTSNRILAAIDRSLLSIRVIRSAIDFAVATDSDLEFLSIDIGRDGSVDMQVEVHLKHFVGEQTAALGADSLPWSLSVRASREVAEEIVSYADETGNDMIVIGTHGKRGFKKLMLGSVALEVMRTATVPVFTIGDNDDTDTAQNPFSQILIPYDFSQHSELALDYGILMANRLNARIDVVHVVEDTMYPAFCGPFVQSVYDASPGLEEIAREKLRRIVENSGFNMSRASIQIMHGHPARALTEYAKKNSMDLIVMTTHGLTGMQHLFMGSVAERTVQLVHCPVLTLRPGASE